MLLIPAHFTLVAGTGEGATELNAFDAALRDAGVGDLNLVKVSSILPPGARREPSCSLPPGALAPTAYARISIPTPGQIISAAIAVGISADQDRCGVIMEHSATAPAAEVEARIRQMVYEGFAIRGREPAEVVVLCVEHRVQTVGACFAGAVLW